MPSTSSQWSARWSALARAAGIGRDEKLLVALSGGADSVLLLHLAAAAVPRSELRAVHVDHGLRGAEGRRDASFCAALAGRLGVPFVRREVRLDPEGPSLEERARRARYAVLVQEALASGHTTILTGHHADDVLETLFMRWARGSSLSGLAGPRRELELAAGVRVLRPLRSLRREEVRRLLSERGLAWREDSSNADLRHTRNRVRHGLFPALARWGGDDALDGLRAFAKAVESLEDELARATAHVAWSPPPWARSTRGPGTAALGGVLPRATLDALPRALRRRVLWRLFTEGTGHAPGRALVETILDDLDDGRCTRHALPRSWTLVLRADELRLLPPEDALEPAAADGPGGDRSDPAVLAVPGSVRLGDGRRLSAVLVEPGPGSPVPRSAFAVEMDAEGLPERLTVRWPEAGDRYHALGAPGSKRLTRFLADRGLPREERGSVPLVFAADKIIWVPGYAPVHGRRVRPGTRRRVRLALDWPDDAGA